MLARMTGSDVVGLNFDLRALYLVSGFWSWVFGLGAYGFITKTQSQKPKTKYKVQSSKPCYHPRRAKTNDRFG